MGNRAMAAKVQRANAQRAEAAIQMTFNDIEREAMLRKYGVTVDISRITPTVIPEGKRSLHRNWYEAKQRKLAGETKRWRETPDA